ncbi:MAG: TIGR02452 family protein [Solobacterium sp.]|nr:TIGR02452 family protein [Solobacterium sp.]
MRERNIGYLHETLRAFETGVYETENGKAEVQLGMDEILKAEVFLPDRIYDLKPEGLRAREGKCVYSCLNIDSFSQALNMMNENPDEPVLVLNLANPVNIGGGVRRGAIAQEEDLCRKSSLLLNLEGLEAWPYYAYNRALETYMGSDALIISPKVEVIRDEHMRLISPSVIVSVMTCAAPYLYYGKEGMSEEEYGQMLYTRMEGMLKVSAAKGYRRLVLGAFGCGAFRNDAAVVARLFHEVFENFSFGGYGSDQLFGEVCFAVLCRRDLYNFNCFAEYFGKK